jgi:hypothetical protein
MIFNFIVILEPSIHVEAPGVRKVGIDFNCFAFASLFSLLLSLRRQTDLSDRLHCSGGFGGMKLKVNKLML